MPNDDLQSLLRGCKLNPLDDAPRRVLSDWLEEHNQPERAEFVRLQLARSDAMQHHCTPNQESLVMRINWLFKQYVEEWTRGHRQLDSRDWFFVGPPSRKNDDLEPERPQAQFDRGLILVQATADRFTEFMAQLEPSALPWLEQIELRGISGNRPLQREVLEGLHAFTSFSFDWNGEFPSSLLALLDRPEVRNASLICRQTGYGNLLQLLAKTQSFRPHKLRVKLEIDGNREWKAFANSSAVEEIRSLVLSGADRKGVLDSIARSPHFQHLDHLFLQADNFSVKSLRALFDSDTVSRLSQLHINTMTGIGHAGVGAALAASHTIRGLRHLSLSCLTIDETDGLCLARSSVVETLQSLDFYTSKLSDLGLSQLASANLDNLESLDLHSTEVGDVGVMALANSPRMRNLRRLDLSGCKVTGLGLKSLAASPHLSRLQVLDISYNPLGPNDLLCLATSPHLQDLHTLGVLGLAISGAAFKALLQSPLLRKMEELSIPWLEFEKEHLTALLNLPFPGSVRILTLNNNSLRRADIAAILKAPWAAELVELSLSECRVNDAVVRCLTKTLPRRLVRLSLSSNKITNEGAKALLSWPGLPHLSEISLYGNSIDPALERQINEIVARPAR